MNSIFGRTGSLLLAGAMAFSFASCDTDTRSNQSTVREAENQYETETAEEDLIDPSIAYEEQDEAGEYDYNREYAYEERDVVIDRVRNDLDRAERSLDELGTRMQQESEQASEDMRREWEEARASLEQTRQELNEDLENLERSTEENWTKVRNDANESLRGFEQEWEKLKNTDVDLEVETPEEAPAGE